MLWKTTRPKKIVTYAQILSKLHVLSPEQMNELEKIFQEKKSGMN